MSKKVQAKRFKFPFAFFTGVSIAWNALATQPTRYNAWEMLKPDSEAYRVMKQRCQSEAGEEFFGTAENVDGIFLESENGLLASITGSPRIEGITYTNPPYAYIRNGLSYIEFSASMNGFGVMPNEQTEPVKRFDTKTRNTKFTAMRSSQIRVSYKKTTSDAEQKVGVIGRLIEVTDDSKNLLLARRRDFIWTNPDHRKAHGGYVCPTLAEGESMPTSFLSKVINVKSYKCWKTFKSGILSNPKKYDSRAIDLLLAEMNACQTQYFNQKDNPRK